MCTVCVCTGCPTIEAKIDEREKIDFFAVVQFIVGVKHSA